MSMIENQPNISASLNCTYRSKDEGKDFTIFHFDEADLIVRDAKRFKMARRLMAAKKLKAQSFTFSLKFDPVHKPTTDKE